MQRRASLIGGTLRTQPRVGGGVRVVCTFPLA
jgi:signal transduction histidine kinase